MQLEPAQRKKLIFAISGGLLAIVLIIAAVSISLKSGVENGPAGDTFSGAPVPDDELLVNDLYEGEILIPKFDLPVNRYDTKKFVEKDGFIRYEDTNARLGVDVSEFQNEVDWAAVKAAGIDFAILRLGYRGTTQGLLFLDERFEQNFQEATDAGLFVGVYFFSQAVTESEARMEADFVIEALKGRKLAYPVVFDWEVPAATEEIPAENLRVHNLPGDQAAKCGAAFCERIKEAGYTPCVYTNKYWAYEFFDLDQWKDYDFWYAEYEKAPSLYYDFRMWQYTDEGKVPGIEGGVDVNICFKPY